MNILHVAIALAIIQFIPENRTVSRNGEVIHLSAAAGSGVAWLKNASFTEGTIEVDMKGKDVKQGSFIGLAFHGESRYDCEAVYFRPFNFQAKDSLPQAHMVQYVQDTLYGWERLRDEHPGVYENKITTPPDPNGWFHVKVEVKGSHIKTYINNELCLTVKALSKRKSGKVGLWVGNESDGDFKNLVIN